MPRRKSTGACARVRDRAADARGVAGIRMDQRTDPSKLNSLPPFDADVGHRCGHARSGHRQRQPAMYDVGPELNALSPLQKSNQSRSGMWVVWINRRFIQVAGGKRHVERVHGRLVPSPAPSTCPYKVRNRHVQSRMSGPPRRVPRKPSKSAPQCRGPASFEARTNR
jgi:hypothetical protein